MRGPFAHEVDEGHGHHRDPRRTEGSRQLQRPGLHGPHDLVDQVTGQVRGHEAHDGDERGGREAGQQPRPVRTQVRQEPPQHGPPVAADQRLRFPYGTRNTALVLHVGVGVSRLPPLDLFFEDEAQVFHRTPLPMRVPQGRQRGLAGGSQDQEDGAAQSGDFPNRLHITPLEGVDPPGSVVALAGGGRLGRAQGEPPPGERHGVVEVGEGIQLHRLAVPAVLDPSPEVRRHVRGLVGVALDDSCVLCHVGQCSMDSWAREIGLPAG